MPSLDQSIRAALVGAALKVPDVPQRPNVAFENQAFSSTLGTAWMRLTVQPASERPLAVSGSTVRHDGLFLVDLFVPANSGVAALDALANAVKSAFRPGSTVTSDGVAARIDYAERARGMVQEPDWLMLPITIRWHVFSALN